MGQLDTDPSSLGVRKFYNPFQGRNLTVGPDALFTTQLLM